MSVLDNIKAFWSRFEDEEPALLEALKVKNYEKISEILDMLNEETNRISGAHFFVEDNFDEPEMTFDSGPASSSVSR